MGTTVERSNQRTLMTLLDDHPGVTDQPTHFSGCQTCIDYLTLYDWTLAQLADYCLLDDEDLSRLEDDVFTESWNDYIAHDILSNLQLPDQDIDPLDHRFLLTRPDTTITTTNYNPDNPLTLLDIYNLYTQATRYYPIYESPNDAYVDTEKVTAWILDNARITTLK